jgi:hypothetical protein
MCTHVRPTCKVVYKEVGVVIADHHSLDLNDFDYVKVKTCLGTGHQLYGLLL